MPMNTALLNALKEIVSRYGGVETLSDARRVKALLADLAATEPRPQKNALIACLEGGFAAMLQNVPAHERGAAKAKLAERLNREEGLDAALCADTLDLLEAALLGSVSVTAAAVALTAPAAAPETPAPLKPEAEKAAGAGLQIQPAIPPLWNVPIPSAKPLAKLVIALTAMVILGIVVGYIYMREERGGWRELITLNGHASWVNSVVYSPDGRRVASGADDRTVRIWDAESGRELLTLNGHTDCVYSVVYSSDGRRIASGANDRTAIWDAESGRLLQTLEEYTGLVTSVAYSPDGRRIASGSIDGTIMIWDAESGRELLTLKGHADRVTSEGYYPDRVNSVAYSPDGRRIASGSWDKTVMIWDAESGRLLQTLEEHTGLVTSVAYSPDGHRIASGSGGDSPVMIWDAESGRLLQTLKGHNNMVTSVAYSPDGHRIVSGSSDNTIKIWRKE